MTREHWRGLRFWLNNQIAQCRREMADPHAGAVRYAVARARACTLDDVLQRMNHERGIRQTRRDTTGRSAAAKAGWKTRRAALRHAEKRGAVYDA